jgi:hypothetical protein
VKILETQDRRWIGGGGEGAWGGGAEGLLDILDSRIKEKKVAEPQIFITFSNRISIWKNRFYVSRETVSGHHARDSKNKCEK